MNYSKNIKTSPVPLDTKSTIAELRTHCPLPILMQRMGYAKHTKRSCCSPLRADHSPSWGIFQRQGRWWWKDQGTGESGDELDFICQAGQRGAKMAFAKALDIWSQMAAGGSAPAEPVALPAPQPRGKPDGSRFGPGSEEQLERLATLRQIDARGLLRARERGLLVFGRFLGHEVYGVTDASGHVLEVRRLDGKVFPAQGDLVERKSHAIRGSRKNWPVGIANAGERPMILLVEGLPDLLAAFEVVDREQALDRVAPVAMLSASCRMGDEALPYFNGRHVRIIPHGDAAGHKAARQWKEQLILAGARAVDFVLLTAEAAGTALPSKDLNDHLPQYRMEVSAGLGKGGLLS